MECRGTRLEKEKQLGGEGSNLEEAIVAQTRGYRAWNGEMGTVLKTIHVWEVGSVDAVMDQL